MIFIKLSETTIINLSQIQYCKIYRTPVQGQLVPQVFVQLFFSGEDQQSPVQFEGEEAERIWQALEYRAMCRPDVFIDQP
ncbi:MAG: hypothetical protein AB1489_22320 [Acidobacteriota bacterium]